MNESSSIYVDKIAIEKIKTEKLGRVSNSPKDSLFNDIANLEEHIKLSFSRNIKDIRLEQCRHSIFRFISPVKTPYPENNYAVYHLFKSQCKTIGSIIFVHGLFDDNKINYNFLFSGLNKSGFDVYLLILPYHYERKPMRSYFGGEYFWSADILRTKWALLQSVEDFITLFRYLIYNTHEPVYLVGFSMGGGIVLNAEAYCKEAKGIFLISSISSISRLPWESPVLDSIKNELISNNINIDYVVDQLKHFDPLSGAYMSSDKTMIVYGKYDQVIEKKFYEDLLDRIKPAKYIKYNAGHLNMLRVPRLANDISLFFQYF